MLDIISESDRIGGRRSCRTWLAVSMKNNQHTPSKRESERREGEKTVGFPVPIELRRFRTNRTRNPQGRHDIILDYFSKSEQRTTLDNFIIVIVD